MPELQILPNPQAQTSLPATAPDQAPYQFHQQLPGYAPTPLIAAPTLAAALGVGQLWVKDESSRFGLPAFKVLGASWATYRALLDHLGLPLAAAPTLAEVRDQLAAQPPLTLTAATDGNHGRAVARVAHWLGLSARIIVPDDMVPARRAAITAEGAELVVYAGTYDDAVAYAASTASPTCLVIADTAWPGYEAVPRWVIDGYSTILWEVTGQLAQQHEPPPNLVAVQIGVGALAAAVTRHYRQPTGPHPRLIGVEPADAACVLASVAAQELVMVPGPHRSIMAGLNCGQPSPVAWPIVSQGIDLFLAISDDHARDAMRALATVGVVAGETGAAGLAGCLALLPQAAPEIRAQLGLTSTSRVLVFNTEGATDPTAYTAITGQTPPPTPE